MKSENSINIHDQEAADYDRQVKELEWYGHDAIFGMCYEYVKPGERLLDIGIGTGLGSIPFAGMGVEIFGIDGAAQMLKICQAKNIARELKQFDLQNLPLPYTDCFFDHVLSCGVFHFFGDLRPLIEEASRIIKPGGIFAFTIAPQPEGDEDYTSRSMGGGKIFMHRDEYISKLLQSCAFDRLKELTMLAKTGVEGNSELLIKIHVVQKSGE